MSDTNVPDTYDDGTGYDADPYSTSTDEYSTTETWDSTTSMQLDTDQDGVAETTAIDFDGDGVADAFDSVDPNTGAEHITLDVDMDGKLDTVISDFDGDGTFEAASQDTDGDGQLETSIDPETGEPTDGSTDGPFTPFDDGSTDTADGDTELDDTTSDGVHGDPMAEIPYHQAQVGSNDCLPTSVAMILTEATGITVDQGEVVDLANELGLLGETGMSMEGGLQLLEHWGVEAEVQTGSMDSLRDMLDSETPVIIGLDSDDLYGQGDQPFSDDLVAGHAVVITGIDDEAGLVYINDPGFPDGAGIAIPIEQFEDAWQDADNTMIVAEVPADDDAGTAGNVGDEIGSGQDSSDGLLDRITSLVLLPFNLIVR
jgi:hypothetical protein